MDELRKIVFRGFNKKRGIWLYGNYILNRGAHFIAPQEFADGKTWEDYEVEEESIGQFIGLYDRNGKEIYEGDIIDVHIPCNSIGKEEHRTRVVVWNEKYDRFEFQDKRGDCIADSVGAKYNVVYYEVVGNVFDNPELLEEGDEQ